MTFLQAAVLGFVQGTAEFIPVSSSAHLVLFPWLLKWPDQGLAYDVALHWGTLLALLAYFRKDVLALAAGVFRPGEERGLAAGLILATLPGALAGLLAKDYIETVFRRPESIALALILFGVLLGLAERRGAKNRELASVDLTTAALIGLAQALAVVPGVSRSGATITAALFLGLRRVDAARYSFLLGIPIIFGAGALKLKDLDPAAMDRAFWTGITVSFLSGLAAIRFLLEFLSRKGLLPFAVYRVLLGAVIILLAVFRV